MLRIRIAAVDAVAEDRHVSEPGLGHNKQLMHRFWKAVDHHFGFVGDRVQKQHLATHLVDGDDAFCVCRGHLLSPSTSVTRMERKAKSGDVFSNPDFTAFQSGSCSGSSSALEKTLLAAFYRLALVAKKQ